MNKGKGKVVKTRKEGNKVINGKKWRGEREGRKDGGRGKKNEERKK